MSDVLPIQILACERQPDHTNGPTPAPLRCDTDRLEPGPFQPFRFRIGTTFPAAGGELQ